jgi:hypothetical protein
VSYSYCAYGLFISSDIAIPGLYPLNDGEIRTDLSFEAGPEPKWASDAFRLPSRFFHKELVETATHDPDLIVTALGEGDFFELQYSDGVRIVLDRAAGRMWGQWSPPLTVEDFATYFLGPVMGFVLRRRGLTALHASSVSVGGHAVVFSGEAHAGKSTTAAALALRGVSVLCEDISAVNEKGGSFWVESGYPRICLWPDSVRKLLGAENALPRLTPTWEKCYLALDDVQARFEPQKRPLGAVYLFSPRADHEDAPRIEELAPREALLELVRNTYMNWILDRKQRAAEFDVLARIVANTPVRRVVAHSDAAKIGNLCELLISDAEQLVAEKIVAGDNTSAS